MGGATPLAPGMWRARALPRVRDAFAAIWGTHDLLTSFDGANVFRPWNDRPEWRTDGGWYHVDQGTAKQGCHCVQGLLTLTDASYHTGGLVVVPGSHHAHADLCARLAQLQPPERDFLPVPLDDPVLASGAVLVCARAPPPGRARRVPRGRRDRRDDRRRQQRLRRSARRDRERVERAEQRVDAVARLVRVRERAQILQRPVWKRS